MNDAIQYNKGDVVWVYPDREPHEGLEPAFLVQLEDGQLWARRLDGTACPVAKSPEIRHMTGREAVDVSARMMRGGWARDFQGWQLHGNPGSFVVDHSGRWNAKPTGGPVFEGTVSCIGSLLDQAAKLAVRLMLNGTLTPVCDWLDYLPAPQGLDPEQRLVISGEPAAEGPSKHEGPLGIPLHEGETIIEVKTSSGRVFRLVSRWEEQA